MVFLGQLITDQTVGSASMRYPIGARKYPNCYHYAIRHLIEFGACHGDRKRGRRLMSQALRAMRATDRDWAVEARRHFYFISGNLPVKNSHPLA